MTRFLRLIFVVYAIALFVATHMPQPAIPGSGFRVDLLIHAGVFGLWNLLFFVTGWAGPRARLRSVVASTSIAGLASIADEISQSLPIFDRTFGFDDMTANLVGVVSMGLVMAFIASKLGDASNQTTLT